MNLVFLAVLVGIISCDTLVAGQFMLARPIIAAPLIGLCMGNPYLGFLIGVCVELVWIRVIPVGSSIPPDGALTAVIAVSVAGAAKYNYGIDDFAAAILALVVSIPFGIIFKSVEIRMRFYNSRVAADIKTSVIRGFPGAVDKAVFFAVGRTFLTGAVFFITAHLILTLLPRQYWEIFDFLKIDTRLLMRYVYILCFTQLFETFVRWK